MKYKGRGEKQPWPSLQYCLSIWKYELMLTPHFSCRTIFKASSDTDCQVCCIYLTNEESEWHTVSNLFYQTVYDSFKSTNVMVRAATEKINGCLFFRVQNPLQVII
jgi:hypothetical protein